MVHDGCPDLSPLDRTTHSTPYEGSVIVAHVAHTAHGAGDNSQSGETPCPAKGPSDDYTMKPRRIDQREQSAAIALRLKTNPHRESDHASAASDDPVPESER